MDFSANFAFGMTIVAGKLTSDEFLDTDIQIGCWFQAWLTLNTGFF